MVWWELTVVGVVFAFLHVALGWLLRRSWPPYGRKGAAHARREVAELRHVAQQLAQQVVNVNRDISEHQGRMHEVNRGLAATCSEEEGPLAQVVLSSVADILRINARLQSRLEAAETKLRQQGAQIESWMAEARTDPLTGVANRRAFDDALEREIARWRRKNIPFSVVIIDLDHFKKINDQHGHPAGDTILRLLADLLGGTIRKMDTLARIGGEEFAAILPSTPSAGACRAAENCRRAVASQEFWWGELQLRLTVSVGVAVVDSRSDANELVARADRALYMAKQAGRNCVYLHNGRGCVPATASTATEAVPASASEGIGGASAPDDGNSEFVEISRLLRERLEDIGQ